MKKRNGFKHSRERIVANEQLQEGRAGSFRPHLLVNVVS